MTLLELKMKKAELRNRMNAEREEGNLCIQPETFVEYNEVLEALKWAESWLLKPIVASIAIALLFVSGCNTVEGMRQDVHQWTETPAHHK
jgi:predicted small secreted protein